MNGQELIEYLKSVQIGLLGSLCVPIGKPADISEINLFEGFGIENPTDSFNRGWKFLVQDGSNSQNLQAFCAGTIVYEKRQETNRIILRNADVLGNLTRKDSLPDWFPLPNYIIYENIDERQTKNVLRIYLRNHQKIVRAIEEQQQANVPIDRIVELFASNSLPYGIPVQAGDLIGIMAENQPGTSGLRTLSLYMQHELDNYQGLFLDPAIYHKHWESFFQDLAGYPLEMQLKLKKIFAGPIANGVIRYVKSGGGTTGDFLDPSSPAGLVSIALAAATPFDTIVIMDNEIYNEPKEIDIDDAINITSLNKSDVITPTSPPPPTLEGNGTHRVIRIYNSRNIVSISNVSIAHGRIISPDFSSGHFPFAGGGILIDHAHKTYIRNCHIHNNSAKTFPDDILDVTGDGGGIMALQSSALIYHNRISENVSANRGGGIGIFGYGWPVIQENLIRLNRAIGGNPDGGGIGIVIAYPNDWGILDVLNPRNAWNNEELAQAKKNCVKLIENEIDSNKAPDDGGGVYLTALSRAEFFNNKIHDNVAGHAGGGIRATMGSDLRLERDHIHHNIASDLHQEGNGGGGIAIRNCSVTLKDVRIEDNIVEGWSGGGIFFASNFEGPILGVPVTWDRILREVFEKRNNLLNIKGTSDIVRNHCEMACILGDHRKGGGFYALRIWKREPDIPEGVIMTGLPMTIIFDDINRIVSNVLDPSPAPCPTPVGSPNSVQIHIEDTILRPLPIPPIDDSNNGPFLTPKGNGRMEFQYVSLKEDVEVDL